MKKYKKKLIVGLTGGPAAGKSTAVKTFKKCGAYIVDADKISREVLKKGNPALREIVRKFGAVLLLPSGELNRRRMRNIIFKSPIKRKLLEKITHPEIIQKIKTKLHRYARGVVVLDAPLLFEAKIDYMADRIVVISALRKNQIKRLQKRDHIDADHAAAMINAQDFLSNKIKKADFVIMNNKDIASLKHEIKKLYILFESRIG